jgi:hypothetical protein
MANVALMLALAAVMAAERFAPPRLHLGAATGTILLGASAFVAIGTVA